MWRKRKTEESDQGVRDQDTPRKQSNKDYVDSRFRARDREVKEGDQVVVRSPHGVQCKRNRKHVKPFLTPDREDRESTLQAA